MGIPGHTLLMDGDIDTAGAGTGNTVMGTLLLVTVVGFGQTAFEVISTVTVLPFVRVVVVNVALFVPALDPFTFHW
jgi:hypothetical protein